MRRISINQETVEAAILGGAILAAGEGGSIEYGRALGNLAIQLGHPSLIDINELSDGATLLCVSIVGAPAAPDRYLEPVYHIRSVEKFIEYSRIKIDGIITNANGGTSTVNGWLQSVALGIPVVDAACNGRYSPTGVIGSMGLHLLDGYQSIQMGIGGNQNNNSYVEVFTKGSLLKSINMIRQSAVEAGGALVVARNPISVSYAKTHAAVGGISQAIALGHEILSKQGNSLAMVDCVCSFLKGDVMAQGKVNKFNLSTQGSYDYGLVIVGEDQDRCSINFLNQYLTMEKNGKQVATFPDLIIILSLEDGLPLSSSKIKEGQEVAVIVVPKERLILGTELDAQTVFDQIRQLTMNNNMLLVDR